MEESPRHTMFDVLLTPLHLPPPPFNFSLSRFSQGLPESLITSHRRERMKWAVSEGMKLANGGGGRWTRRREGIGKHLGGRRRDATQTRRTREVGGVKLKRDLREGGEGTFRM